MNNGLLCTKGLSNREYGYRKDRILTPLKRVGARARRGNFRNHWEEAYREHRGPAWPSRGRERADSVLFFGGYSSGSTRLHRWLAYSLRDAELRHGVQHLLHLGLMAWKVATDGRPGPTWSTAGVFSDGPQPLSLPVSKRKTGG